MATTSTDKRALQPESPQAMRLKDAAYMMARDGGLAALSARSLSRETGMSPSAINYYFGNRDLLISEVCDRAVATAKSWRDARVAEIESRAPDWADLDHIFTSLLQDRLGEGFSVLALLQELEHEAAIENKADVRHALGEEMEAEFGFWQDLATNFGEDEDSAQSWACLALGLIGLMLSERDAAVRSAWISAPASRLRQRLARRPVELVRLGGPDAARLAATAPANETAETILKVALEVIAEKGPERLVQREVAARAGVSLAAITYFFRTKSDLISAAFSELCRQHCLTLADDVAQKSPESLEQMLIFDDSASLSGMAAMEALLRAAVRMPELASTADLIRKTRGVATLVLLRRLELSVDQLDAYLWSTILSGHYRRVRFKPSDEQASAMRSTCRSSLRVVFG